MGKELFSRSYADFSFDGMPRLFQTLSADTAQLIEQAGGREPVLSGRVCRYREQWRTTVSFILRNWAW